MASASAVSGETCPLTVFQPTLLPRGAGCSVGEAKSLSANVLGPCPSPSGVSIGLSTPPVYRLEANLSRANLRTDPAGVDTLGGRIYRARIAAGLSQAALGVAIGLAPEGAGNTVSRWETNRARPSELVWPRLAEKLGVSREALEMAPPMPIGPSGARPGVAEPSPRPYDAGLTPEYEFSGHVTEDLEGRSAGELRLLLRGAMMGGAAHDRLLRLLDALERALEREGKGGTG